MKKRKKLEY